MTAATAPDVPTKSAVGKQVKIDLSGDPRVQLLPPAVRDRAASRSRIRTGVLFVVLGLIIAGGLVAAGSLRAVQAQQALLDANNRTTELLAEQARYQDAVALERLITQAKQLEQASTELEIDWGPLLRELVAELPEGGSLLTVTGVSVAPWESASTLTKSDDDPAGSAVTDDTTLLVAAVTLTLSSVTIKDATDYSRRVGKAEGALGCAILGTSVGTDGGVYSTVVLLLGIDATSGRFASTADGDASTAPAETTDDSKEN